MRKNRSLSILWAVLAAGLYAIGSPLSKLLLQYISPMIMAAFLYLGAGMGMCVLGAVRLKLKRFPKEENLSKQDIIFTMGMIILDIAAPIFLMFGLTMTTSANASLLNNFEIVSTALIALFIFKEKISRKLWIAIGLITLSSIILSFQDMSSLSFSTGSLFVLLACVCWGFENNCTRMLSQKDPLQIVVIKGLCSGFGSLAIAYVAGERMPDFIFILLVLLLGFISYGLSIFFYVYAQRRLGAAKTSAYYAIAPFIGVLLSFALFKVLPDRSFLLALFIMIVGTYFASADNIDE